MKRFCDVARLSLIGEGGGALARWPHWSVADDAPCRAGKAPAMCEMHFLLKSRHTPKLSPHVQGAEQYQTNMWGHVWKVVGGCHAVH